MNFFKKLSLFFTYRKSLLKIEKNLETQFGSRVDRAYRIYTVLNIPKELIEEPYNLRKSDIDVLAQNFIKDYSQQLSKFLDTNGLMELYDFYDIEKVEKYSYLLIFGFKLFNTQKFLRNAILIYTPLIVSLITLIWLYFIKH
jgi:hypothetical protein